MLFVKISIKEYKIFLPTRAAVTHWEKNHRSLVKGGSRGSSDGDVGSKGGSGSRSRGHCGNYFGGAGCLLTFYRPSGTV